MGNHNSSGHPRKRHENECPSSPDAQKVNNESGKTVANGKKRKTRRKDYCVSDNFIVHGIDFLPEKAKRKERRKKNVPKFLLFDEPIWQSNPLSFFARFQNSHSNSNGTLNNKSANKETKVSEPEDSQVTPGMMRSHTACAGFSDEKLDWKSYSDYPFKNIVMSGGGSKGYAYIGSLKALEDCGILRNITKVAGSSAGAICAGLLAIGCSPQEIADVFKCDIKWLFHDQTCACCCCLPRVCNKFGIHPAKRFHEIYGEHLKKKVGNPDITFLQLKESLDRELCIVVTNLSRMCSEYLNHNTTPDLPIRDAVRMSMAFPVVFRAVRYNIAGRECVYTDGGLLDQYPIHCFDATNGRGGDVGSENGNKVDDDDINNSMNLEGTDHPNMATLGLYVVSEKPIDHKIWLALFNKEIPCKPTYLPNTKLARERLEKEIAKRKMHNKKFDKQEFMDELCSSVGDGARDVLDHYEIWNKSHVDITNFGEYFVATLETLLISQRKLRIKTNDSLRTVAINCGYIGTNDYVIEPGDREFMIDQGYTGTVRYLREFIASRKASAFFQKGRKAPRSRSSNLADQYKIPSGEVACNGPNSKVSYDLHLQSGYFLPEEDTDGEVSHRQKSVDTEIKGSQEFPRCRHCSRNSSDIAGNELPKEEVTRNFFRTCRQDSERREEFEMSDATKMKADCNNGSFHDGGGGCVTSSDSRLPFSENFSLMSTSTESEGYSELVNRALLALNHSEQEPILESRV